MNRTYASVCVPVLNGAAHIPALIAAVERARARARVELIVVDSGSTDGSRRLLEAAGAMVLDLGGRPFTHAWARNRAASHAEGELLVFLTQDVEPVGDDWLERLAVACSEPATAGAFGRQIPRGATPEEAYLAHVNYPEAARTVAPSDLNGRFGPGSTLFSSAFGAMRRDVWLRFPFPEIVHSEDQAWALGVLRHGLVIRYEPAAAAYHGHRFGFVRLLRRNFDSGSALQQLGLAAGQWSVGARHLWRELTWIAERHGTVAAARAFAYESVRMAGFQLGRLERILPRSLARRLGEAPRP